MEGFDYSHSSNALGIHLVNDNVSEFKNEKLLLDMTVSGSNIVMQLFILAPFLQSFRLLRIALPAKYSIVTSGDA
jgi:hypothetical protein